MCHPKYQILDDFKIEVVIIHFTTMFKLLVVLFIIKFYAGTNIFKKKSMYKMLQLYKMNCQSSIFMVRMILRMKKEQMDKKCDPSNLFLEGHKYNEWHKNNEEKVNHSQKKLFLKS